MQHFSHRRLLQLVTGLGFALLLLLPLLLFSTSTSEAQCGSSTSSCKNCHEIQGQDPVNDKGEWHTAHAFGDFCEFCHAGNVQAQDEAAAHQGLVDPLSDVKAGCQSCHPDDYMDRAKKYAVALGVELGTGGGGGAAAPPAGEGPAAPPAQPPRAMAGQASSAAPANSTASVAVPSGGEIIDFNQLYAESQAAATSAAGPGMNRGDAVLVAMIVLLAFVFIGLVWHFENVPARFTAWWQANMVVGPQAVAVGAGGATVPLGSAATADNAVAPAVTDWSSVLADRPELGEALAALATADPATVEATIRLLRNRPLGPRVVKAVARLDLNLLSAVKQLDAEEVELLMALRKEL